MDYSKEITFFLPCRAGSQRVPNKNTKEFAGVEGGLTQLKLQELLKLDIPIILSTDDEKVIEIGNSLNSPLITIDRRPKELCLSTTKVVDLINYVPKIVNTKHVFWLHVTTPLVDYTIYRAALHLYFTKIKEGFDSIMSVTKYQSFLWDDKLKDIINYDRSKIKYPQTQDLDPLYEINHAFYAMSIEKYIELEDRIGKNPYLFELNKIQATDVDWQEDFEIAEALYMKKNKI